MLYYYLSRTRVAGLQRVEALSAFKQCTGGRAPSPGAHLVILFYFPSSIFHSPLPHNIRNAYAYTIQILQRYFGKSPLQFVHVNLRSTP